MTTVAPAGYTYEPSSRYARLFLRLLLSPNTSLRVVCVCVCVQGCGVAVTSRVSCTRTARSLVYVRLCATAVGSTHPPGHQPKHSSHGAGTPSGAAGHQQGCSLLGVVVTPVAGANLRFSCHRKSLTAVRAVQSTTGSLHAPN
jgi:hypothetical protein